MNMNKILDYIKIYTYIYLYKFKYPYSKEFDVFIDNFITQIYFNVTFLTKRNNSVTLVMNDIKYRVVINNFPDHFLNKITVYTKESGEPDNFKLNKVLFYKVRCSRRNMIRFSKLLLDNNLTIIGSTFFRKEG
jgi:hypothetical protein